MRRRQNKVKQISSSELVPYRPGVASPRVVQASLSADARQMLACIETMNPLRGLTSSGAQNLFDSARRGDTTRLQWLYNEIEGAIGSMLVCAERRASAIAGYDWHIAARDHVRKGSEGLRDEQVAALDDAFADIDQTNFSDAIEHLSGAFFRGFAHVSPLWADDGLSVESFDLLDGWNVVRDAVAEPHVWRWNPNATPTTSFYSLPVIPPSELLSLVRPRHIDYPALQIALRVALGDRSWGKFIDRYGIPPVIIIMPPDIDPNKSQEYLSAAAKVADGGSGALPNGSLVEYAEGGRGVDPFTAFVERQEKSIVLLCTGGMLTSLSEATGIGGGASSAHEATWREIVKRDIRFLGDAVTRQLAAPILDRAFPGQPQLAYFSFDQDPAPTTDELFDTAAKAVTAGYRIVQSELEEKSGFKLEKIVEPMISDPSAAFRIQNSEAIPGKADSFGGKSRENGRSPQQVETDTPEDPEPSAAITGALADTIVTDNKMIAHLVATSDSATAAQEAVKRYLASRAPDKAALIQTAMAAAMKGENA